jgi:hypothetical protein
MTDPFYMIMLLHNLGPEYRVWDQAGRIDYLAPGRGTVTARFELTDARLAEIRAQVDSGEKILPEFDVDIVDEVGIAIARVRKTIYVRLKQRHRPQ